MNNSFLFYKSWLDIIEENYSDDEEIQNELIKAIIIYGIKGEKTFPAEKMFLMQAYAQIDSAIEKHDKKVEAGRKGGLAGNGGAPKGNQNAKKNNSKNEKTIANNSKNEKTIAHYCNSIPNENDNSNDNVNYNENENDNDNIISSPSDISLTGKSSSKSIEHTEPKRDIMTQEEVEEEFGISAEEYIRRWEEEHRNE